MRPRALLAVMFLMALSVGGGVFAASEVGGCTSVSQGCDPVVSLDLHDVEIRGFVEAFAREYGINMVVSPDVEGRVSASLNSVPLFDALDAIVESKGYVRREFSDGLMVVETGGPGEISERGLEVREFRLRYLDIQGSEIANTVEGVLSSRGRVMQVVGSNALVVKDISIGLERAAALLGSLDTEPGQVVVEAKMVEISKGRGSVLGINWGAGYSRTSGNVFGGLGTVAGDVGVNFPSVEGDTGAVLGFGVISDRVSLDLAIQALETANEARVVSSPRVQVAENTRAVIADGEEVIVPSFKAQTVISASDDRAAGSSAINPGTFRAVLGLAVTPRVVADGRVLLEIEVMREWFDQSEERKVEGVPLKHTKTATTRVFLATGETLAIGGIETDTKAESTSGVPLLSRIPLLGALFRSRQRSEDSRELVIFLTPYIAGGQGEEEDVAGTGKGDQENF